MTTTPTRTESKQQWTALTLETVPTQVGRCHKIGPLPGRVGAACIYEDHRYDPAQETELLQSARRLTACWNAMLNVPDPERAVGAIREYLVEIVKGAGPFSADQLTHATNCIETMQEHARSALALLGATTP